ncbi:MAG: GtrA family protein [Actinobacteria bacterium]|nr:GtrA family protein [Actinomycetota bacterium]
MSPSDLYQRHRHSLLQFVRFGLVGGLGVVVNQVVLVLTNVIARDWLGMHNNDIVVGVPFTDFNVRNYHVYVMIAFLVANLSNFMFNRHWTFRSARHAGVWKEYWPFLAVGLAGQVVGLALITALMHPHSPIGLPSEIFDNSTGFRTKLYWANLITIVCVTPLNFVFNKLWTFRAVRRHKVEVG